MDSHTQWRSWAARALDLAALAGLAGIVWLAATPAKLGGSFEPGPTAGVVVWIPLLLAARTLIEVRPPSWAIVLDRLLQALGARAEAFRSRAVAPALAGSVGTAVGGLTGWAVVHPLTDYPPAVELALVVVGAGVALGLVVGGLTRAWLRQARSKAAVSARIAALGGSIAVLAAISVWNPARGWEFPRAQPVLTGLLAGILIALAIGAAVLVAAMRPGTARRAGIALTLALLPALVLAWTSRTLPGRDRAPSDWPHAVLLITIDTLRADHLGAYGYPRETSPRIDAFAAESILFRNAFAPMPTTDPSHVALLTGRLPRTTGVVKNGVPIVGADPVESLASWFADRDYRTGAVTSRAHLDPAALRLPGFQTASVPDHESPAPEAYRRASAWIDRHGDRPFFLWVHFWDPHAPYKPPVEEAVRFLKGARGDKVVFGIHPYPPRPERHSEEAIRFATALYDAEIRYADSWVGRLIDETRERFDRENVLIALTSDHGETLGEYDESYRYAFDHGKILSKHELHVPLILGWPGRLPAGARVERSVPTAGLAPTIASVLGESFDAETPGFGDAITAGLEPTTDAVPFLVERRAFDSTVEVDFLAAPELGVVDGRWLYVENPLRGEFLHDLQSTTAGAVEDTALAPARARAFAARLRELTLRHPPVSSLTDAMDPATIEKLRSLGYIQ